MESTDSVPGARRAASYAIRLVVVLWGEQQIVDFFGVETCKAEVKGLVQLLQFEREQLFVPRCPRYERFTMRRNAFT
jgi:hypothetical protein